MLKNSALILILIALAGIFLTFQGRFLVNIGTFNLGKLAPAFVFYATGLLIVLAFLPFQKMQWAGLLVMPKYLWLAGVTGVFVTLTVPPTIEMFGLATTIAVLFAMQMVSSVVLDHFGLLGATYLFTLNKAAGVIAMFVGMWLILS